jgi:hypothetical protein
MDAGPFALKDNAVSILKRSELQPALRRIETATDSFGTRVLRGLMDWFEKK